MSEKEVQSLWSGSDSDTLYSYPTEASVAERQRVRAALEGGLPASDGIYSRLPQSSIRLLKILPDRVRIGSIYTIAIRVEAFKRNDAPAYTALSYVWGSEKKVKQIQLNGKRTLITENLYVALSSIRDVGSHTHVWADAVSINQADPYEKAEQVEKMGDVYERCAVCLVFLGEAFDSSQEPESSNSKQASGGNVFSKLKRSFRPTVKKDSDDAMDGFATASTLLGSDFGRRGKSQVICKSCSQAQYRDDWEGLPTLEQLRSDVMKLPLRPMLKLASRPWWRRIWVIHEFVMPKRVEVMCGSKRVWAEKIIMGARALSAAVEHLHFHEAKRSDHSLQNDNSILHQLLEQTVPITTLSEIKGQATSTGLELFWFFLITTEQYQATLWRDKMFALLGLASNSFGIKPDYASDKNDLLVSVSRGFLTHGKIEPLLLCRPELAPAGLPSWALDWSQPLDTWKLITGNLHRKPPKAAGAYPSDVSVDGNVMQLQGVVFDRVHRTGLTPGEVDAAYREQHPNLAAVAEEDPERAHVLVARDWLKRFQTLVSLANVTSQTVLRTSLDGCAFTSDQAAVREFSEAEYQQLVHQRIITDTQKLRRGTIEYANEIMGRMVTKRPFVTATAYVGIGPEALSTGDIIALFFGADLPFVLRPVGQDTFRLVGPAYVDGIMYGEFLDTRPLPTLFSII